MSKEQKASGSSEKVGKLAALTITVTTDSSRVTFTPVDPITLPQAPPTCSYYSQAESFQVCEGGKT